MKQLGLVFVAVALTACSYKAEVLDSPSYNVASSYGEQIPGLWLLYVDATALQRPITPTTLACSAYKYPIDAAGPFTSSVRQTLDNVVDQLEVVPGPMTSQQLIARGARGMIIVRGEDVRAALELKPGFWSASMDSRATIIASVTVDGKRGRVFGQTVEGTGNATSDAGIVCSGGAKALGQAVNQGMGDTMRRLGEAVSNSERVRGT